MKNICHVCRGKIDLDDEEEYGWDYEIGDHICQKHQQFSFPKVPLPRKTSAARNAIKSLILKGVPNVKNKPSKKTLDS